MPRFPLVPYQGDSQTPTPTERENPDLIGAGLRHVNPPATIFMTQLRASQPSPITSGWGQRQNPNAGLTRAASSAYDPFAAPSAVRASTRNTAFDMPIMVTAGGVNVQVVGMSTDAETRATDTNPEPDPAPDFLTSARYAGGTKVIVSFSDGWSRVVDLADLGIDLNHLQLSTVGHSLEGSAMEVTDNSGQTVHVDSSVLRAQCDPQYAAELRGAIAELSASGPIRRISADRQRRLDYLMEKNNEGELNEAEQDEFRAMVGELEQLTIDNARRLAGQG